MCLCLCVCVCVYVLLVLLGANHDLGDKVNDGTGGLFRVVLGEQVADVLRHAARLPRHETEDPEGGDVGSQMAERLGNRAIDQKVAGSIPGRRCVLGQSTSPYFPRGERPRTYCKSLWSIRASAK